jgi:hypothetical protein
MFERWLRWSRNDSPPKCPLFHPQIEALENRLMPQGTDAVTNPVAYPPADATTAALNGSVTTQATLTTAANAQVLTAAVVDTSNLTSLGLTPQQVAQLNLLAQVANQTSALMQTEVLLAGTQVLNSALQSRGINLPAMSLNTKALQAAINTNPVAHTPQGAILAQLTYNLSLQVFSSLV